MTWVRLGSGMTWHGMARHAMAWHSLACSPATCAEQLLRHALLLPLRPVLCLGSHECNLG